MQDKAVTFIWLHCLFPLLPQHWRRHHECNRYIQSIVQRRISAESTTFLSDSVKATASIFYCLSMGVNSKWWMWMRGLVQEIFADVRTNKCMRLFTFSLHAHKPMPRKATPRNWKRWRRETRDRRDERAGSSRCDYTLQSPSHRSKEKKATERFSWLWSISKYFSSQFAVSAGDSHIRDIFKQLEHIKTAQRAELLTSLHSRWSERFCKK